MCPNPETTSARKLGSALRDIAIVLAATGVALGTSAGHAYAYPPTPVQIAQAAQPAPVTYTVEPGDNLTKIAARHGLDPATGWRLLYDANPSITNPDLIMPGQQLRIPAAGEAVPPRSLPAGAPAATEQKAAGARPSSASAPAAPAGSVWDRLAQCESSGNWSSNVGLFDGGLQFHPGTWKAYGGTQYASSANHATREQQIAIAKRVLAGQGWRAWPACSRKLGLR